MTSVHSLASDGSNGQTEEKNWVRFGESNEVFYHNTIVPRESKQRKRTTATDTLTYDRWVQVWAIVDTSGYDWKDRARDGCDMLLFH